MVSPLILVVLMLALISMTVNICDHRYRIEP